MKEQIILLACFFGILALLAPAQGARVFGNLAIFGQTDNFPARTVITASNADTGAVLSTLTVSSKSYNILVPNNTKVAFLFEPTQFVDVNGWTVQGLFPRKYVLDIEVSDINLDILDLQQCFHLVLEAYNSAGHLMNFDEFSNFRWMSDLTGETSRGYWSQVYKGNNVSDSTLSMTVPLSFNPSAINIQFQVPDFGNIVLYTDNGGAGWKSNVDGGQIVQFNYEVARTFANQLAALATFPDYIEAAKVDSVKFSLSFVAGLYSSLESSLEVGTLSQIETAASSDAITVRALEAIEGMEMVRADLDIKKYRTSDVAIYVFDYYGNPIPNATVSLFQTDHDFKFGAYGGEFVAESPDWWLKLKAAGLNNANLAFWWAFMESVNNSFDDSFFFNQNAGFLKDHGFKLSSTGIFQLIPTLLPNYITSLNFTELLMEIYSHVKDTCDRYLDDFEYLEFAADMHQKSNLMGFHRDQANQMLRVSYQAILDCKKAANKISIHCNHDYFSQSKRDSYILDSWDTDSMSPAKFHEDWVSAFKEYDTFIGNGTGSFDAGVTIAASQAFYAGGGFLSDPEYEPAFHMGVYSNLLDRLAKVPSISELRVTEVGVPGAWLPQWDERDAGWWHTKWNEATQAEFIKELYVIAFSKAKMKEISWWGVSDQYIYYPQGNWLKLDGTTKAAYYAVQSLIDSWTTDAQVVMDKNGMNHVVAYGGNHKVNLTVNGIPASNNGEPVYLAEQTAYMTIILIYNNMTNTFKMNATILPPTTTGPSVTTATGNNVIDDSSNGTDLWPNPFLWIVIAFAACFGLIICFIASTYVVRKYRKVSDEHSEIDSLPPQDDEGRGRQKGGKLSSSDEEDSPSEASSKEEDRAPTTDSDIDIKIADKNVTKNQALMAAVEQRSTEESSTPSDSDSISSKTSESGENSENSEEERNKGASEESDSDSSSSSAGGVAKETDSSEEEGLRKPEAKLKEEDSSDSDE